MEAVTLRESGGHWVGCKEERERGKWWNILISNKRIKIKYLPENMKKYLKLSPHVLLIILTLNFILQSISY